MIQTTATLGMVNPILAKAEPKAKFILVCNLFFLAAITAAIASGRKTSRTTNECVD